MSFRIPHSRFAKGFFDDFLGRLFQTRPNPFVFRPRPARSFPLVLWRQTAHNILRRPAIGLDRIDRRDRCHAFRVPLLAATEPTRQLVPRRFDLLLRRLPQILMTHHDSFPIHRPAGVAARVLLHRSPPPALPPRPDRAPRYALPKAAASTRGHASRVLSPNRFLSSCRPPSSPETSRSRRSFHELGQTRRDSLQAGPTPLSTPSIAERRHAPEDKSVPSWAPPLHHGDADPAVPSHW